MAKNEDSCLWEEMSAESEFEVAGSQPVMLCHHPQGKGFCDFQEDTGETRTQSCPYFKYSVPFHEVELEQHFKTLEPDRNKPEKRNQT
jgi:hypothetical protein